MGPYRKHSRSRHLLAIRQRNCRTMDFRVNHEVLPYHQRPGGGRRLDPPPDRAARSTHADAHTTGEPALTSREVNPLRAVGQAVHWEPKKGIGPTFIGTCFAYRRQGHFITAAHCLGDLQADQLGVMTPQRALIKSAIALTPHPTADIAIIETPTVHVEGDVVEPFELIVSNWSLGEDFFAFGYPIDVLGPDPDKPTERLFKGHFQRFLDHKSQHLPF